MEQELVTVQVEKYDQLHDCITVQEVRWILRHCKRHSPYYTYFLLRATTGVRGSEILSWTLYHFSPDLKTITYRVDKPFKNVNRNGELCVQTKHRRVELDQWVANELRVYLETYGRVFNGEFVLSNPGQKLFSMRDNKIVISYWYKLRRKMEKAGLDSFRLWRLYRRPNRDLGVFVLRPHIFRHFAASVMYYRLNKDIKAVQEWIKHEDSKTTSGYIHSADSLGVPRELLEKASWAELLEFDEAQTTLRDAQIPSQTTLEGF
ncbi:site-specific integrase [Candidatus Woesearchaeota archaeon]|nr:site-specific integrase [Candidatus Woesearchaeota archaeon]